MAPHPARRAHLEIRYRPLADIVSVKVLDTDHGAPHTDSLRITQQPDPDLAIDWQAHADGRLTFRAAVVVHASNRLNDPHLNCLAPAERLALRHAVTQGQQHAEGSLAQRFLDEQVHVVMSLTTAHGTVRPVTSQGDAA
jgi:hypothetical protein